MPGGVPAAAARRRGGGGAVRAEPALVPIYIAALGPANLALTGELDLVVAVSAEFTADIEADIQASRAAGWRHAAGTRSRPARSGARGAVS